MSVASRSKRIRSTSEENALDWTIRVNPYSRPSPTSATAGMASQHYSNEVYSPPVASPPLQLLSTTTHTIPLHLASESRPSPSSFSTLLSTPDLDVDPNSFSPNSEQLDFSQTSFDSSAAPYAYAGTNYYPPSHSDPKQQRYPPTGGVGETFIAIPSLATQPPSHIALPPTLHPSPHQPQSPRPLAQQRVSSEGNTMGSGNGYVGAEGGPSASRERSNPPSTTVAMPRQTGFVEQTRRGEDIGIGLSDFDMLDTLGQSHLPTPPPFYSMLT